MVAQTLDAFGCVDVLVNNAAIYQAIGAFWEVDENAWWADVYTNLYGSFLCCRAVLPHMTERQQGIIINMTGGGAGSPMLGASAYGSSKAGLMRMSDSLAFELQKEGYSGIQVYGLSPGFVRSGISEGVARSPLGQKWLPFVKEWIDAGQHHPGEDVGEAIVKLCRISRPCLSGRIFSYDDDFAEIHQRAEEIKERDLLQIRPRSLN
jgi:3-oxoacyl-[acyl-carrier protein] reductase